MKHITKYQTKICFFLQIKSMKHIIKYKYQGDANSCKIIYISVSILICSFKFSMEYSGWPVTKKHRVWNHLLQILSIPSSISSNPLIFLSSCTFQKIAMGISSKYFFQPVIPFHAHISSLTKPIIIQLNPKILYAINHKRSTKIEYSHKSPPPSCINSTNLPWSSPLSFLYQWSKHTHDLLP